MISKATREYKVKSEIYKSLSKDEKSILPILKRICKLVADIYLQQENENEPGANFYPRGVTNKQIELFNRKNHQILSPFTIIEKTKVGFQATPYHVKYAQILQPISTLLFQAGKLSKNKTFSEYLKVAAESLINGDYQQMDRAWLKIKNSQLVFLIGPYERNLDKKFFVKMAYLSFVGIINSNYDKKAKEIRDIFFSNFVAEKTHRYTLIKKLDVIAVANVMCAGWLARTLISTGHIPSDDLLIERFGSKLIGYISTIDYKFEKLMFPIFNAIFEKRFRQSYSKEQLRKGGYYLLLTYGLSRQLHRYEGSRERLKELFPVFDEANSMVAGIQHSKYLLLKGVISQKDLEAMIIMHICWMFSEWIFAKISSLRSDYLKGDSVTLNFYLKENALLESQGISWPNFPKIFFTIEYLAGVLVRLLSEGSYTEATNFLNKNLSSEIFKSFDSRLSAIHFPE